MNTFHHSLWSAELPTNEEDFDDAQISAGIRFQGADANKDGRLDKEEFVPFIHPFRHDHMVGHLVEDQLVLYDEDQDGHISFNEYLSEDCIKYTYILESHTPNLDGHKSGIFTLY